MSQELENLNSSVLPPNILKTKLKKLYRSQNEIPKLIEIDEEKLRQTWDERYIELTLLSRQKPKDKANNEIEETKEFQLENIFDSDNSSEIRKVLFLGVGGAGKSTLLHYISYKWGKDELWGDRFDIVFRIRLKHLLNSNWKTNYDEERQLKRNKFACFIHHNLKLQCFDLEKDNVGILEEQQISIDDIFDLVNEERVLLLVDGYNEVSHLKSRKDTEFQEILNAINQYKYTIISSRPNAFKVNDMESFDRLLEIKSLDLEKVMKYINSFHGNDDELNTSLTLFLERNNQIRGICEITINMVLLCLIWGDENIKQTFQNNFDVNIQLLYREVILWLGKKYLVTFDNWEPEHIVPSTVFEQEIIQFLQNIAFDSFVEQGNFVSNELIRKHLGKLNIGNIYKFGILTVVGVRTDIVNMEYQFIHPTFQEFLTALHLNSKLVSNDKKEVTDHCNLIGQHRNEPKYLMMLKFLAGMVSSQQFKGEKSKDDLVKRSWESFTCNVDGILEFGLEAKVSLLMHLLEQSKVNGTFDKRIPNLGDIIKFIDTAIFQDITKWQAHIIESGYISPSINTQLNAIVEDTANQDKLELRVAVEVFTSLVNKSEFGGKSSVLQRILKVLSLQNWQLQKLILVKIKQLLDSRVKEDLMKDNLKLMIFFVNDKNLTAYAADLLIEIVSFFPNLIHDMLTYIKLAMKDVNCNDKNFGLLVVDIVSETLSRSPNDVCFDFLNLTFEIVENLFLSGKYNRILHSYLMDGLLKVIQFLPKNTLIEKINKTFMIYEKLILIPDDSEALRIKALHNIPCLMKFLPENALVERGDNLLIFFEKILKSSQSVYILKRDVIRGLPEVINALPADQMLQKVNQTFDLFDFLFKDPQTNDFLMRVMIDNMPSLVKCLPNVDQLKNVMKLFNILDELIKKEFPWKQCIFNCVSKLVKIVVEDDLELHFDNSIKIFNILCEAVNNGEFSNRMRKATLLSILELIKFIPPNQKIEIINQTFNFLTNKIFDQNYNIYFKSEIVIVISSLVEITPETHKINTAKQALRILNVTQDTNADVLRIQFHTLNSVFNISVIPQLIENEPSNLLIQINQAITVVNQMLLSINNDLKDEIYDTLNRFLLSNLIPSLVHLPNDQKFEKANQIFEIFVLIMQDSNINLYYKWGTSIIIEKLIRHMPKDNLSVKLERFYELLKTSILETSDQDAKITVLNNLPKWASNKKYRHCSKSLMEVVFKLSEGILNDPNTVFITKMEAIWATVKWCKGSSTSSQAEQLFQTAFNTLRTVLKDDSDLICLRLLAVSNLNKLINEIPKQIVDQLADDAVELFFDVAVDPLCDNTVRSVALNGIANVLNVLSEKQTKILDDVLKKLTTVILEDCSHDNRFVVVAGLPQFVKIVRGSGYKILALLQVVLRNEKGNYVQGEARRIIALVVENYTETDQHELARQAFEMLINQNDDFSKYFGIASVECLAKITKAMTLNESVDLLRSDIVNVREGAMKGILSRLTASDTVIKIDYTKIVHLLTILECCREKKEDLEKDLYSAAIVSINKIIENITDDGIVYVLDNFYNLTKFDEVKVIIKGLYLNMISNKTEIIAQNIYVLMVQCIKFGLSTTIQRALSNKSTQKHYNYHILFENVSCTIDNGNSKDLDQVISTALQLDNPLAEQYREYKSVFKNSGSPFGIPVAAFDLKICSLVNEKHILNSESWHLSLLHLSDQNKSEPTAVFALIERRDYFGHHLIYKVYVENQKLCFTFHEQHPNEIDTKFCEEIFSEMQCDFIKLIKPIYYASLNNLIQLKEGENLIQSLEVSNVFDNVNEYEIIHEFFKDYFDNISWDEYKIGGKVVEIKNDFLLKLDDSRSNMIRIDSQIIDKLIEGDQFKKQQKELQNKISSLEEELKNNSATTQEDKTKIQNMLDKLKYLEKLNSKQRQRIVEMTQTIYKLLKERELTADGIMALEQQWNNLQSKNAQIRTISAEISQLNEPNINYCGSDEANNDDEYYLNFR